MRRFLTRSASPAPAGRPARRGTASTARRLGVAGVAIVTLIAGAPGAVQAAPAEAPAVTGSGGHGPKLRNVGYFTQWGIYGRAFLVKNLDTSGAAAKLTHINYAFGNVNAEGLCASVDVWADYQKVFTAEESVDGVADNWGEPLNGNFGQLLKLKAKHPKLKVNMSLGGWTLSKYFSDAVLTAESRRKLVSSCVDIFIKGNLPSLGPGDAGGPGSGAGVFDGIDLDWEWPNWPGNPGNILRPEDKKNFTLLLTEFRRQLDAYGRTTRKHYELTAFLPANPAAIDAGFEVKKIFKYFDFATVQGYDFHGTWESITNQQSALRRPAGAPDNPDFTASRAINAYTSRGAPSRKLVLGIPYYGQGWTGVQGGGDGLFQPAAGPAPGTWAPGTEDYKKLAQLAAGGTFTVYRDWRAGHAWLFDGTTFWTFDDPVLARQKTWFIRRLDLGGAMVWSLDGDDANATMTKTIAAGLS
ncbi:MAG TPA: glycoside hydrolase family 18 protein [Pilimelia sp.]|nr:glycoside hydrolase family 18 protein [Pilimelia sp.]